MREIEKLRCEAQDNGNINWDNDFSFFCQNIKDTLCSMKIYFKEEREKIGLIMDYLKDCGEYANQWNEGFVSDEDVDMDRIAYTKDNLYSTAYNS